MSKRKKNQCLHCAFFKAHMRKWNGRSRSKAFQDMVESSTKITGQIFTHLSEDDRAKYIKSATSYADEMAQIPG
jgi:hypothetical protein